MSGRPSTDTIALQARLAESIEQQRNRTTWNASRTDGANPTLDGLHAGAKSGTVFAVVGSVVVGVATAMSPGFRASTSPGVRAWLVCTAGMAGFFLNSEMAVVGTEAREKAASMRGGRAAT